MKVKYREKGFKEIYVKWMPPWASNVIIEEQCEELPLHWYILTFHPPTG
jgi:hypothetical protein